MCSICMHIHSIHLFVIKLFMSHLFRINLFMIHLFIINLFIIHLFIINLFMIHLFTFHCLGLGWGFQAGGELTDFILVLSTSGTTSYILFFNVMLFYVMFGSVLLRLVMLFYMYICVSYLNSYRSEIRIVFCTPSFSHTTHTHSPTHTQLQSMLFHEEDRSP
jgi:hypothetical protein